MLLPDGLVIEWHAAHQGHDDLTAQHIVASQFKTSFYRQAAFVQMSIIGIQRTNGRAIRTAHLAYGRHAETNHIVFGTRRVALEIAMQALDRKSTRLNSSN